MKSCKFTKNISKPKLTFHPMAKQAGPVFFTGTIDGLIFYKLGEEYYVRRLGKYKNKKQMRRSPKYERTMKNADQFGEASALSKWIYYDHMPRAARKHGAFGRLTGVAYRLIQEGKSKEEVTAMLIAYCRSFDPISTNEPVLSANKVEEAEQPATTKVKLTRYLATHKIEVGSITPQRKVIQERALAHSTIPILTEKRA
jgi:hypothetical protein